MIYEYALSIVRQGNNTHYVYSVLSTQYIQFEIEFIYLNYLYFDWSAWPLNLYMSNIIFSCSYSELKIPYLLSDQSDQKVIT